MVYRIMQNLLSYIVLLFGLICFASGHAQVVVVSKPDSLASKPYFDMPKTIASQEEASRHLEAKIDSLRKQGFLAVSVDSMQLQNDSLILQLYLGKRVEKMIVSNGNIDSLLFLQLFANESLNWEQIETNKQKVLDYYVKQGYIGAEVYLDEFDWSTGSMEAKAFVSPREKYTLDSLVILGDVEISQNYIRLFFGMEKEEPLTKELLDKIDARSNQSSFFQLKEKPAFKLKEQGKANLYLQLEEKKGNAFDLLVGFLPNPNPQLSDRGLLITGEGNLRLLNPFGEGREIIVDYKQQQPESPLLHADLFLPIVFGQKFGSRASFDLQRQDSSFVNVFYSLGVNYQFGGGNHITASFQSTDSFIQDVNIDEVMQTRQLPPSSDYKQSMYSLEWRSSSLNTIVAPTKGLSLQTRFGAGTRNITPSQEIIDLPTESDGFEYASLYQEINDNPLTLVVESDLQYFIPLKTFSTIKLQNQTGYRYYNQYFDNDLYRIGGLRSVRGFDERSVLSSLYAVNTAEWRLLLGRESFFSVFTDAAYTQNDRLDTDNVLIGIGSGLDLATKAGIFSINLAVGRDEDNPFDLQRTRIHFGYVNVF